MAARTSVVARVIKRPRVLKLPRLSGDVSPPVMSGFASTPHHTSADISFTTDEPATTEIQWVSQSAFNATGWATGQTIVINTVLSLIHSGTIPGLSQGVAYRWRARGTDQHANLSAYSVDQTVTTTSPTGSSGLTFPDVVAGELVPARQYSVQATLYSLGSEVRYSGDTDNDATCTARFKKTADATWRNAIDLDRQIMTEDIGYKAFYGSVLMCTPGTSYDLEFTITDPDAGSEIITRTITTAVEPPTLTEMLALTPDYWVSPTGGGTGLSEASPMTLTTLMTTSWAAGDRKVAKLLPGEYKGAFTRTGTGMLDLVAKFPAVTEEGQQAPEALANLGNHSAIVPQTSQVIAAGTSAWEVYNASGPGLFGTTPATSYAIWRTVAATYNQTWLTCSIVPSASPNDIPVDLPLWKRDNAVGQPFNTPEGWAEFIYTNMRWNVTDHGAFGYYKTLSSGVGHYYCVLPEDADPNDYTFYFAAASTAGLYLTDDMRVYGLEVRGHYWSIRHRSRNVISHCQFGGGKYAIYSSHLANGGINSFYEADTIVQWNYGRQTGRWRVDTTEPESRKVAPWSMTKLTPLGFNGASYPNGNRPLTEFESTFNYAAGASIRTTYRFNRVYDYFNGLGRGQTNNLSTLTSYDRYAGSNYDYYRNHVSGALDEVLEPEGPVIGVRFYENYGENCAVGVGVAPAKIGNMYIFCNRFWRIGDHGARPDGAGNHDPGCNFFKYGEGSDNPAVIHVYHNIFWTDSDPSTGAQQIADPIVAGGGSATTAPGTHGIQNADGNTGSRNGQQLSCPRFKLRNNITRVTGYAHNIEPGVTPGGVPGMWDEDYNIFVTAAGRPGSGISLVPGLQVNVTGITSPFTNPGVHTQNGQTYRSITQGGQNTNNPDGLGDISFDDHAQIDALLTNPSAGILTLKAGVNKLVGTATPINNINDLWSSKDYGYAQRV